MSTTPDTSPFQDLQACLSQLPGIGPSQAQRITYHIAGLGAEAAEELAEAISLACLACRLCSQCRNITEQDPCGICQNPDRDTQIVCVVEQTHDLTAIERTRSYRGLYHVLHGVLSPSRGVTPEDLSLPLLFTRVSNAGAALTELIIATNPSMEGDATADFIRRHLDSQPILITRIARGMPIGGSFEFADTVTIHRAITTRAALTA